MLAWLIRFCSYNVYLGRDDFSNSRQTCNKIPHLVPKFWQIPLPWYQSNPESHQDIFRFPESRTVFWSNPGSREYPSRPCAPGKRQLASNGTPFSGEKEMVTILRERREFIRATHFTSLLQQTCSLVVPRRWRLDRNCERVS